MSAGDGRPQLRLYQSESAPPPAKKRLKNHAARIPSGDVMAADDRFARLMARLPSGEDEAAREVLERAD
jgi:hypothetical protein